MGLVLWVPNSLKMTDSKQRNPQAYLPKSSLNMTPPSLPYFPSSEKNEQQDESSVSGWCQDWNNSSCTITEVKHLELNQFLDG